MGNISCTHGNLARFCDICDLEKELSSLRTLLAKERDELGKRETEQIKAWQEQDDRHLKYEEELKAENLKLREELRLRDACHIKDKIICPDCEAPCELGKRMDGSKYLRHAVYACPKQIQVALAEEMEETQKLEDKLARYREALEMHDTPCAKRALADSGKE